ncbi:hypothetical protein, partial [Streptomyces edwardsiae]
MRTALDEFGVLCAVALHGEVSGGELRHRLSVHPRHLVSCVPGNRPAVGVYLRPLAVRRGEDELIVVLKLGQNLTELDMEEPDRVWTAPFSVSS